MNPGQAVDNSIAPRGLRENSARLHATRRFGRARDATRPHPERFVNVSEIRRRDGGERPATLERPIPNAGYTVSAACTSAVAARLARLWSVLDVTVGL